MITYHEFNESPKDYTILTYDTNDIILLERYTDQGIEKRIELIYNSK